MLCLQTWCSFKEKKKKAIFQNNNNKKNISTPRWKIKARLNPVFQDSAGTVSLENEDAEQSEHNTRNKAPDAMTCTEMNLFASKADLWHIKKLE